MEIEFGWGMHDVSDYGHLSEGCQIEREYLDRFLDVCDRLDIPVSFDIVGHLLLNECSGHHPGPYPERWFEADPGTDFETDPMFYAPDVVDMIAERTVDHELCTHTFSHALFDQFDAETASADLERAQQLHESVAGRPTVALVPPRHQDPPVDSLRGNSIEIVRRGLDTHPGTGVERYFELLGNPPELPPPRIVDGVVETYTTTYPSLTVKTLPKGDLRPDSRFRILPRRLRKRLALRRLRAQTERAIDRGVSVHFWCHLYGIASDLQFRFITEYLEQLAAYRDTCDLEVLTMEQLNDRVRAAVDTDRRVGSV